MLSTLERESSCMALHKKLQGEIYSEDMLPNHVNKKLPTFLLHDLCISVVNTRPVGSGLVYKWLRSAPKNVSRGRCPMSSRVV